MRVTSLGQVGHDTEAGRRNPRGCLLLMNPLAAVILAIPISMLLVVASALVMRKVGPLNVRAEIVLDEAAMLAFVGAPMTWFAYITGNATIGLGAIFLSWFALLLAASILLVWRYSSSTRNERFGAYRTINCVVWFLAMCITYLPCIP